MNIAASDGIGISGHIEIRVFDGKTKELVRRVEIRNKITFLAADILVSLVAQRASDYPAGRPGQIPNNQIYTMRMGTSNTPASRGDTNLGNPVIGKVIGDAGKITTVPGEIAFTATLDAGDANNNTLQEAGLFTKGASTGTLDLPGSTVTVPRLFARQIYPGIPKTNAITLEYTWRIAFTV